MIHPKPAFRLWYGVFRSACRSSAKPLLHTHAYFEFERTEDGKVAIRRVGKRIRVKGMYKLVPVV